MKRLFAAALFAAALSLSLVSPAAAQGTRTYSLKNGDTITPASHGYDPGGAPAYIGGQVAGQLDGATSGTFSLWVSFRNTGIVDAAAGVYSGEIVPQYSSFAVTEGSGRKSVTTSGTIDAGTVTYRLLADGRAEVISVVSGNLTVWQGKNKRRTAVGYGTLDYGTSAEGSGAMALYF
jgi:hypothetical protein